MSDQDFDRLFNRQYGIIAKAQEAHSAVHQTEIRKKESEEEKLRKAKTIMTVTDAIKRILLAYKDKDYFRLLELPPPELDALNQPQWSVTPVEVSKAYRRLSILVHPDKNPGDDARKAFEALNEAHRMLKDPGMLETILTKDFEFAKKRKEESETRASLEERLVLNARQKEKAAILRKERGALLREKIIGQMKDKHEKALSKRKGCESSYRRKELDDEERGFIVLGEEEAEDNELDLALGQDKGSTRDGSDDEDASQRRRALAKKRQRKHKGMGL